MKLSSKLVFLSIFFAIICVLSSGRDIIPLDDGGEVELVIHSIRGPGRRSLLSSPPLKQEIELIAAPNGTIYLVERSSRKVLWSFSSGPPIYSSYRAPVHQVGGKNKSVSYLDFGEDWELYMIDLHSKVKFNRTIQAYVKSTPEISKDRGITLGSVHATVFEIDPWTGKVMKSYGHSGSSNVSQGIVQSSSGKDAEKTESSSTVQPKSPDVEFYIKRIDYTLRSYGSDIHELWNLTVAFFEAELQCKGKENFIRKDFSDAGDKLIPNSDARILLSCLLKFDVHRFSNQAIFESFLLLNGPLQIPSDNIPPVETQTKMPSLAPDDDQFAGDLPREGRRKYFGIDCILASLFDEIKLLSKIFVRSCMLLAIVLLLGYAISFTIQTINRKRVQHLASRRRRNRKSGKVNATVEEGILEEHSNKNWMNLNGIHNGADGYVIGKLFVSAIEIAKGSNGTVVFEGLYDGRKVAVKRLVKAHHGVAYKEVQNLIASDQHPNIVRWHGVEYDKDFVYLVLEHCTCNFDDLIQFYANAHRQGHAFGTSWNAIMKGILLWKSNGYPSSVLLKLMRDVVAGLVHLHELGIVHRDIKPQNILITNGKPLCAKLSDMGISKSLPPDMSSLGHHVTGSGSSGWQAPELLCNERQTKAVDMFSLGCVFFYCVTGGGHPFGDRLERDFNIKNNKRNLQLVDHIPEAMDLFSCLLDAEPKKRPTAYEVLHHPLFWDSERRLSFLRDVSDRVELEDRDQHGSNILHALESAAHLALGSHWDRKLEPAFINNIGRYRRYRYDSVRDLLRVVRNKYNHYRELPREIQEILGPIPEGFDDYFTSRFPKLLIEVYKVIYMFCKSEKCFQKYFGDTTV